MSDHPTAAAADKTLRQSADELETSSQLSSRKLQRQPPARVPGYEIRRCLGAGAYGSVWLAIERNTGKQVAIKFYSHRHGLDWSLLSREVEKLAVLYTCRDIVGLQGVGWDADPPYYIMEYLDNGSLATRLEQGPLPVGEAVRIATSVAQALVHAHGCGILHCDLKPANVLLDKDDSPRLADFGQSRLSHEQETALGTLFYMAPEQADLHAVPDARWDVYALGALIYQTLVGEPPFRTTELEKRVLSDASLEQRLNEYQRILHQSPKPIKHRGMAGVDKRLAEIVDRCLEVNPARRFANAQAVLDALHDRARARARRPLISLGIAGPAVLLLALVPIALRATDNAVITADELTSNRALEGNLVTAKVLAKTIGTDFDDRARTLVNIANNEDMQAGERMRDLIRSATGKPRDSDQRQSLGTALTKLKRDVDETRTAQSGTLDSSWFLTDGRGNQLWRDPPDDQTIDKNYAWRDYFHGRNVDYPRDRIPEDIEPIHEPHVSLPFRSTAREERWKVAITAPVLDDQGEVLGVLGRSIELGDLLESYKRTIQSSQDQTHRPIALVDIRNGMLLDHPWMTPLSPTSPSPLERVSKHELDKLTVDESNLRNFRELSRRVRDHQDSGNLDRQIKYHDPVGRIDRAYDDIWLASAWPIEATDLVETDLVVVVQERKSEATAPVKKLRNGLLEYGLWALVVCAGLIAVMWYFVLRAMANGRAAT